MNEESPARRSVPPRAPQPVTINGNRYEFDPASGAFAINGHAYVHPRRGQRARWAFDEFFRDDFFDKKSEDWYIPGGKE